MTHRELCRAAARWLIGQRWCAVAGYEIGGAGGVLDAVGVSRPADPEAGAAVRAERELVRQRHREALDRWGASDRSTRSRPPNVHLRWGIEPDRRDTPRIVAVEAKRTRSDLLADLRASKMLRYQDDASHCYLGVGPEVLERWKDDYLLSLGDVRNPLLAELTDRGLPTTWGVVVLRAQTAVVLRVARSVRTASVGEVRMWTYRVGQSLAHRATGTGPTAGECSPEGGATR